MIVMNSCVDSKTLIDGRVCTLPLNLTGLMTTLASKI